MFINDVIIEFGKRNSYELECLAHSEMPWIQARNGLAIEDKCNKIIPKNITKKFYKQKLYGT